ncbi:vicilin Car i 2.0101-like isoform X1 [Zingiber officinale]|uniref:vicilin Car i 2.0101-like isoform X1 n=1 Tax=Zingiber officinale TaxID=94328 RepID=UPI001C4B613E|nr:vicilin Car i 2.0101-like isoform X1 [Zingiber officinale]
MATKPEGLLLLLAVVLLLSSSFADDSRGDPEKRLQQCRQQCRQQQQLSQRQRMQCERSCEEQYERQQGGNRDGAARRYEECLQECSKHGRHDEQQRRQCASRCEARYQEERRGRAAELLEETIDRKDPEQRRQECREDCRQSEHGRRQEQQCEQRCEVQYREERGHRKGDPQRQEEEEEEEKEHNPYHFDRQSFRWIEKTEHGDIRVLPNFLEKSKLLLGIANYRITVTELKPRGFVLPQHVDADAFVYVAKGSGVITLICQDKKETYELRQGDIIKVPAGAIRYLANKDDDEKLVLIDLLKPVSTPGLFEFFYGAGAQNFLKSFSDEILEAAFDTRGERVQRLFGQQKKTGIVTASEEQIRGLSRQASEGRHWPFGESQGTFNLLRKRPVHSSRRGQLHEADGDDYQPLKEHDIQISYVNITQGSMIAPYFNSRATKIAIVVEGEARIETICPHLSEQRQSRERQGRSQEGEEGEGQRYKRVRFHVRRGSVVVLPPGHPTVVVASSAEHGKGNFEAVCFEIWAEKNEKNFLAGKNNVWKQMEREAKELAFDVPAREVDEVLQAQSDQIIIAGPEERQGGGDGSGRRRDIPLIELATAFV